MKNCRRTLSEQGYGVLFNFQGGEWRPCYAGLRFPLTALRRFQGMTPIAAGGTPANPSAFVLTLAVIALN